MDDQSRLVGLGSGPSHQLSRPRAQSLATTVATVRLSRTPTPSARAVRRSPDGDSDESGGEPKRRRVPRACDICRRRKIRCDGPLAGRGTGESECTHCRDNQFKCTYVDEPARKGPPRGYITALQERCSRLENLVRQLHPGVDIVSFVGPAFAIDGFDADAHATALRAHNIPPFPSFKRFIYNPNNPPTSASLASSLASPASVSAANAAGRAVGPVGMGLRSGGPGVVAPSLMATSSAPAPPTAFPGSTSVPPAADREATTMGSDSPGMYAAADTTHHAVHAHAHAYGANTAAPAAPAAAAYAYGYGSDLGLAAKVDPYAAQPPPLSTSSSTVMPSASPSAVKALRGDLDTPQFYGKAATHNLMHALNHGGDVGFARELDKMKRPRIWKVPEWEVVVVTEGRQPVDYGVWPEDDQAALLIDAYFSRVNAVFPLLLAPLFRRQYFQRLYVGDVEFAKVCLMVFANGARFVSASGSGGSGPGSGNARFAQWRESSDQFSVGWKYLRALVRAGTSLRKTPTLFSLQATALVGFFLRGNANPSTIWAVAGDALRACQELGIHVDNGPGNTLAERQERQLFSRAFWCLYHLDRSMCVILGRAVALPDSEVSCPLPLAVDDEYWDVDLEQPRGQPSTVSAFIHSLALDRIVSNAVETLPHDTAYNQPSSTTIQLAASLNAWYNNLPADLQWDPTAPEATVLRLSHLHARYHWARIYIHYASVSAGEWMSPPSLEVSLDSARVIFDICSTLLQHPLQGQGCPIRFEFIDYAWLAAAITLVAINTGALQPNDHDAAMGGVSTCIATLQQMEVVSRKAGQIADLLSVMARSVATQAQTQTQSHVQPPTPPAVRPQITIPGPMPHPTAQGAMSAGMSASMSATGSGEISTPVSHRSVEAFPTPEAFPFLRSPDGSDLGPALYYDVSQQHLAPPGTGGSTGSGGVQGISAVSPDSYHTLPQQHYHPHQQYTEYYEQGYYPADQQQHHHHQPRVPVGMPFGGPALQQHPARPGDERWGMISPQYVPGMDPSGQPTHNPHAGEGYMGAPPPFQR